MVTFVRSPAGVSSRPAAQLTPTSGPTKSSRKGTHQLPFSATLTASTGRPAGTCRSF